MRLIDEDFPHFPRDGLARRLWEYSVSISFNSHHARRQNIHAVMWEMHFSRKTDCLEQSLAYTYTCSTNDFLTLMRLWYPISVTCMWPVSFAPPLYAIIQSSHHRFRGRGPSVQRPWKFSIGQSKLELFAFLLYHVQTISIDVGALLSSLVMSQCIHVCL